MVTGWLLKVILSIAILGFIVIEAGSPLIVRAQADDAANEVATEASFQMGPNGSVEVMQAACAATAVKKGVTLDRCELDAEGLVAVTVTKKARSYLLYRFEPTKNWHNVQVSATSVRR